MREKKFRLSRLGGKGAPEGAGKTIKFEHQGSRWERPQTVLAGEKRWADPNDDVQQHHEEVEMPEYTGPTDIPPALEEQLRRGEYHVGTIVESFGVQWSTEKAARDIWQNFFDANDYSLSGIDAQVEQDPSGLYTITIEGDAPYDFRKLLHIGGTSKQHDPRSAGGFGEGSAIASFVLLRDHGAETVEFESVGWKLDFALRKVAKGVSTERERGLFAQLSTEGARQEGNQVKITTHNKELVDAILAAKDLFAHDQNPDFQQPTFASEAGGFKVLLKGDRPQYGHLYDAGQRRHYTDDDKWNRVEGLHFWTTRRTLPKDRDRGKVTQREVDEHMVKSLVDGLAPPETSQALQALEPLWDKAGVYSVNDSLIRQLVTRLEAAKTTLTFPPECLANDVLTFDLDPSLRSAGYRLCHPDLAKVGMKRKSEQLRELERHYKLEATEHQQQKIETLKAVAALLERTAKEVWLYSRQQEKNISRGHYPGEVEYVWITTEELELPFHEAVSTYIHELDHSFGKDATREHGTALTNSIGAVIRSMAEKPADWQRLLAEWEASATRAAEE
jgi:hypothetical protein